MTWQAAVFKKVVTAGLVKVTTAPLASVMIVRVT